MLEVSPRGGKGFRRHSACLLGRVALMRNLLSPSGQTRPSKDRRTYGKQGDLGECGHTNVTES
jgi:hypothetical protein